MIGSLNFIRLSLADISKRATKEGFKITEEILEAKGFCQNCT